MNENIVQFLKLVEKDSALAAKLSAMKDPEEAFALASSIQGGFTKEEFVTFLPKSITTAIGMSVAEELGGYVSIAVAAIIVTGVLGNIICEAILKLFKIEDPIAKGAAIGTASHAIGTSKAIEIGEVEGAISSLSIVVAGIMTVLLSAVFAGLY